MAVTKDTTLTGTAVSTYTYYGDDHLGTVRFSRTIDQNANTVAGGDVSYAFEPFGVMLPGSQSVNGNTHLYTGQERDALADGSNMDYMHFRFFSASMGRFQKPDSNFDNPTSNPQGWNLYSYVKGNPVNFNDPTGHQAALQRKPWHSPPPPLEPAQIKDSKMFGDDGGNPCGGMDAVGPEGSGTIGGAMVASVLMHNLGFSDAAIAKARQSGQGMNPQISLYTIHANGPKDKPHTALGATLGNETIFLSHGGTFSTFGRTEREFIDHYNAAGESVTVSRIKGTPEQNIQNK